MASRVEVRAERIGFILDSLKGGGIPIDVVSELPVNCTDTARDEHLRARESISNVTAALSTLGHLSFVKPNPLHHDKLGIRTDIGVSFKKPYPIKFVKIQVVSSRMGEQCFREELARDHCLLPEEVDDFLAEDSLVILNGQQNKEEIIQRFHCQVDKVITAVISKPR